MKRTWAGLLALALLVGIAPQIASAAVKAGSTCIKLNTTTTVLGYKYTCIKSGKKLVWSKGVKVVATPKPSATPTPSPSASNSQASTSSDKYSDQPCKTEGEDLKTETASYKCLKRSDSGALLWTKNNLPPTNQSSSGVEFSEQPCLVESEVKKTATDTFTCVKRPDASLLWSKETSIFAKPGAANPQIVPANLDEIKKKSNSLSLDSSVCKIKDVSNVRTAIPWNFHNATAFPFIPTTIPVKGKVNVSVVYVDWADSPGTPEDYDFYKQQVKLFKDFYWMVSEHTLEMNTTFSGKWFRIPGSYKDFITTAEEEPQYGPAPKKQKFYDAAVAASDAETNYSGVNLVFYVIPTGKPVFANGPHEFNWAYNAYLNTAEGKIYDIAVAGNFFLTNEGQPPWVYYVHETGHIIGIPHQANETLNKPGVDTGIEMYLVTPLGGWDIMSNQGGATRTITSWLRWLAGWLNDNQVICATKETVSENYFALHPINEVNGEVESVVIKLSETKAVVIESRRHDQVFDIDTGNAKDGVIVYTVDSTKGPAEGNQVLLSPRNIALYLEEKNTFPDRRALDVIMRQGDSVTVDGLKIENVYSATNTDYVKVTKVG
jgi:M6 family metalloprotease-like protein